MATRSLAVTQLLNPSTPQRKRFKALNLTRDQRIQVKALHQISQLTYSEIHHQTGFSERQIQTAYTRPATPQKAKVKRKGLIRTPQKQQLHDWFEESEAHKFTALYNLPNKVPSPLRSFGKLALIQATLNLSYLSRIRPHDILRTPANERHRIVWSQLQLRLQPNPEDWENVAFSDETWAVNDPMGSKRVIIHNTEDIRDYSLRRRKRIS